MSRLLALLLGSTAFVVFEGEGTGGAAAVIDKPAAGADPAIDTSKVNSDVTLLDQPDLGGDKHQAVPAQFPENWRDVMSGGDKDTRKLLDRFKAPGEVGKSLRETTSRLRSGKFDVVERPADTEPDALKTWREERGIPPAPTDYKLAERITKRITDADKPNVSFFLDKMHAQDQPVGAANAALNVYFELEDTIISNIRTSDEKQGLETKDTLQESWGPDYKKNMAAAMRFAKEAVPGTDWFKARLPDGRLLGSIPEVVRMMVEFGILKYGDEAFVGSEHAAKTTARKEEIEKIMNTDMNKYNSDPAMKKEYFEILQAEERAAANKRQ